MPLIKKTIEMKKSLYIFFILTVSVLYSCNSRVIPDITVPELKSHLEVLAGDELKGRYPGTAEDSVLLNYISTEFKSYGLAFYSSNGIQRYDYISDSKKGEANTLVVNGLQAKQETDFMPFSFSSNTEITAPAVFAGYGFDFKNDTIIRNDYSEIDVKGKWVLIFRGNPFPADKANAYTTFEKDRDKVMMAKDKGAAGVLLVSGNKYDSADELNAMAINSPDVGIPCFQITRVLADKIVSASGISTSDLENKMFQNNTVKSFSTSNQVTGKSDVVQQKTLTGNVIAYLKGSNPAFAEKYVLIGAHHDHLGMGGPESSSRNPDTIAVHHGADDNASGVSAVLEIAEKFSNLKPGRSIIFATFGAEEKGLIGSKYFTDNCPVPIENIELMINLDMIGRLADSSLQIGGVGTSPEFKSVLQDLGRNYPFKSNISEAGYGPSDHAAFYAKDKPVLFFTTGAHQDYHTPNDKVEYINFEGIKDISSYVTDLALFFANEETGLTFQEAGPKESTSGRYRGKITFGIMPDVTSEGNNGLKVLAVTEGKPAASAGMKKGDIITAIDNKSVGNIQDYMFRLGQLKSGDRVVVTINRNSTRLELLVQL